MGQKQQQSQWKTHSRAFLSTGQLWFLSSSSLVFYSAFINPCSAELFPNPVLRYVHWNLPIIFFLPWATFLWFTAWSYSILSLITVYLSWFSLESAFNIILTKYIFKCFSCIDPFMLKMTLLGCYCSCAHFTNGGPERQWCWARCVSLTAGEWWSQESCPRDLTPEPMLFTFAFHRLS